MYAYNIQIAGGRFSLGGVIIHPLQNLCVYAGIRHENIRPKPGPVLLRNCHV